MFEPISGRKKLDNAACRRRERRLRLVPTEINCWAQGTSPRRVTAIETDRKGARLMLPWEVHPGEEISVAVGDALGFFDTRVAKVVWTKRLEVTGRVIAGVAFQYELQQAV